MKYSIPKEVLSNAKFLKLNSLNNASPIGSAMNAIPKSKPSLLLIV